MEGLSIKAHLWIAFVMISSISVAFFSIFHLMITDDITIRSLSLNVVLTLVLSLVLGYFHARRIDDTIKILMQYIQELINQEEPKPTVFPRFSPNEFQLMASQFHRMAKDLKRGQQALHKLNIDLEQRVEERTKSLLRKNRELVILNQLITPLSSYPGNVSIIQECLQQFFEVSGLSIRFHLSDQYLHKINGKNGILDSNYSSQDMEYIQIICSGDAIFGYFVVQNHTISQADKRFLQTLAHYAGVIFHNEILSQTLQTNHNVLEAVFESMYEAIVLVEQKGKIMYANTRMAKLLGISCDELKCLSENEIFDTIAIRLSEADSQALMRAKQEHGSYSFKISNGGKEQCIVLSSFPVKSIGKGLVWRDVTKECEVDKLKSDLICMVSHEFKTPITSIKGSVETLLLPNTTWDENFKKELLTGIHEDIEFMQELVNDWLDISRIEAKAISLFKELLSPRNIINNSIRKLPKQLASCAEIEFTEDESLSLIYVDKSRLEQVLANLLTNAIRYNDNKPYIRIRVLRDAKFVYITVADNGIGIDEKHIKKVFDRFYCIDIGKKRRPGGTGLGLAICKGIIEAHGGCIQVESNVGVGSVFTVSIPTYNINDDEYEEIKTNH